jgi:hypothetical protein
VAADEGIAELACSASDRVALHLPKGAAPDSSIGRPGACREVKERDYVLNNLLTLAQALLSYILSLSGGALPIGL